MRNVVDLAKKLRLFFEAHHRKLDIPFFYDFPKNSCEGASFFFGNIAQEIFPNETFEIIKGRRKYELGEEYHYWVESDNHVFDLTADQFNELNSPVFSKKSRAMHLGFEEFEREPISSYLTFYTENCMDFERFASVKRKITAALFR